MILYHGSYLEIQTPDLLHSRENVDFGRGFYTTPLYEQAAKWCEKFKRRGKSGIISRYNFDEQAYQKLKILNFDSYSEEWLDFILKCRIGNDTTDYDIVLGGVANDKVFNTVELYFDNFAACVMKNPISKYAFVHKRHLRNICTMKGVNRFDR